jgi:hypothetical protein
MRLLRFIALLLVALLMGTSFAHVLELPAKMQYDGPLYVTLQKSLYVEWGPPNVGGFLEPAAILAALALAFVARKLRPTFALTAGAAGTLLLAFPVVFFLLVAPANAAFRLATPEALPADWTRFREMWEYGHATRFALHLAAFSLLMLSVIRPSVTSGRAGEATRASAA